jgi:hypothetical protein
MTEIKRLASDHTVWHAWMEDHDLWDGNVMYADLELGKAHAAHDYEADEYPEPDDDEATARPEFEWREAHGFWHLFDHGKDTLVRLSPRHVFRNATPVEVARQDAKRAVSAAKYGGPSLTGAILTAAAGASA